MQMAHLTCPRCGESKITPDNITLVGLGLGAIVLLWLVFSMMRKLFGLALLAALAVGGWVVWNDPALLGNLATLVTGW